MIKFLKKYRNSELGKCIEECPGLVNLIVLFVTIIGLCFTVFFGIKSLVPENKKTSDTLRPIATEVYPNCEHQYEFILLNQ